MKPLRGGLQMAQFTPDHFEELASPVSLPLPKVAGREGELEKKNKAGKCKEPKKKKLANHKPQYFLHYHQQNLPTLSECQRYLLVELST